MDDGAQMPLVLSDLSLYTLIFLGATVSQYADAEREGKAVSAETAMLVSKPATSAIAVTRAGTGANARAEAIAQTEMREYKPLFLIA